MPNIQEFRKRAEECRRLAAAVSDPRAKAFWDRSAEDWVNIAAASERLADRRGNDGAPKRLTARCMLARKTK